MKAHLVQSADPLNHGHEVNGMCGTVVKNAQVEWAWSDGNIFGVNAKQLVSDMTGVCWRCRKKYLNTFDSQGRNFLYGVVEGQESIEGQ